MDIKLARQMYELASHYNEGCISEGERDIINKIGVPDLEKARQQYQLALLMKAAKGFEKRALPTKYKKDWLTAYRLFVDMYYQQRSIGITEETDAIWCEWALSHKVPVDVVMMVSNHSRKWINEHVRDNDKLYFGKKVLVKN